MKAIQITNYVQKYSELTVSDIPPPALLSSSSSPTTKSTATETGTGTTDDNDKVLVNITHSALNHVDLLYARGLHQNNHSGLVKPPFVLGLEFAGVVVATSGSRSGSKFKPGDQVWGSSVGGFAEQIAVPASSLQKVPSGWTLHDVAGLGAATAPVSYGALVRVAQVRPGQIVLVHAAAGGLGVVAAQIAHALGAMVIATVGSEAKAEVVRQKLGTRVLGVVRYDLDGWEKEVLKLAASARRDNDNCIGKETAGIDVGVDVVYDTVGLVGKSLRCLRFGGCIVIAGFAGLGGKMESVAMNRVLLKGAKLLGYRYGETGRRHPKENEEVWNGLNQLLESGKIKPIIYATYQGLESVPRALDDLAARKVWGKAVVQIRSSTSPPTARL
ncbi:hypothetical protein HRR83_004320 [Exophiala dermatitidis]|uniref:NADPH2:quinone reductase n=2 Tax=Exophiala dermatitidis TaxID=5970 RepID=H6BQG6_EXODN|nr:NADPH2:quinone reductase [Exophiala dermatitidis NIH/UT8656]KAJ4511642.1 hypothetical protein HRR73_006217 [Exophiala dermatitidis]EHY54558.1 NADPH2:quinone reductase [Exophiala dermatitidis NIH/UT8656]KAJ4521375.1 hypothetical protein HRR74_003198 [Exophiala dermatitidis]KAJ4542047.1 hypothetical protein HRR77_005934 [Exophiala dermatitidis]KAJ4544813.1 hypothetical protein HRR76_002851 [Exophiala dermatitidis]